MAGRWLSRQDSRSSVRGQQPSVERPCGDGSLTTGLGAVALCAVGEVHVTHRAARHARTQEHV
jgi:hypothetical protein